MKKIKYILIVAIFSMLSCKDYLNEEMVSQVSYDYYNTEKGVEDLVNAAYSELRFLYNGEQSFTLTNYGVDEYTQASDGLNKYFDDFGAQLNPSSAAYVHDMWSTYYRAINTCNYGIEKIGEVKGVSTILKDEVGKNQRIAELRFLRAFYYFMLVQQFGSIPLTLDGSIEVRLEFERAPVSDIYNVILGDLRFAESVLPATQSQLGRITKGAARHYLAKVYLTRGSAVEENRGQQSFDMDSAAYWADMVINSGTYKLQDNFADLWKIDNETNSEIILAAQFNNNPLLLNGSGNRVHLYFQMTYDVRPGMQRDILNGRPFRRLMPTNYTIDVFDRKNDSRFYKSFKTAYISNNAASIAKWEASNAPSPDLVGKPKFKVGDTAVFITVHKGITKAQWEKKSYDWYPRSRWDKSNFLTLVKHLDPSRLDITTETAARDGVYARLAETYLIAAEAYGRKENYAQAITYINKVRERAAYKTGEEKPIHFWLVEGGSKGDASSTFSNIKIQDDTYFDASNSLEQYPPSAMSKKARFIHFILNERTRELVGELHRWMDLVRTETFYERVKLFNPASGKVQPFHKLRPIPQQHIDRLFKGDAPLGGEEKQAQQNAGY